MKKLSLLLFANEELLPLLTVAALLLGILCLLFHFLKDFIWERNGVTYTKKDIFSLLCITSLYALVSLWNLGTTSFPVTTWQPETVNQSFILELTESTAFEQINLLYEEGDNNALSSGYQLGTEGMLLEGSNDLKNWNTISTLEKGNIYYYQILQGTYIYKYIRITSTNALNTLTEIAFIQNDSILPVRVYEDTYANSKYPASLVIDEQDKISVHPTYQEQGYFDEIYHPRNAWEIANGQAMYATVHPLTGTNIMALFIKLFGFSPFIYRLPGALCGIGIVVLVYVLAKRLFSSTRLSTLAAILSVADFMHLTTSRIATLEPYSILFILWMFYWMLRYYQISFYTTPLKKTLKLLCICGITMGIAISTKWTACYSAVGLAIMLFTNLCKRYYEYLQAKKENITDITSKFPVYFWITIGCCFIFFIFIPAVIYWLSYLPDHVWRNDTWSIANVWKQNMYMFNYHSSLNATHPYESTWYMWLLDIRPIWYYGNIHETGVSYSIACFSNPLLTWFGFPAVLYTLYSCIKHKDSHAWWILIGFLTALGPWMLVDRCVFSYHFYPTSIFTIFAIVYMFQHLLQKYPQKTKWLYIFETAYILLFILFLPVTAGHGTVKAYIKFLEWFPTWYFG